MKFSREFAMPNANTFSIKPIKAFIERHIIEGIIIDPFSRNSEFATHTNDLNPSTVADLHVDAEEACKIWFDEGVKADVGLFDPPYSPRQISEMYKSIGLKVGMEETQNARLYKRVRDAMDILMKPGSIVLSFGWQSMGMGLTRGYEPLEIVLVTHGGAHNDTICFAERKL
jgi:hypothetical protein